MLWANNAINCTHLPLRSRWDLEQGRGRCSLPLCWKHSAPISASHTLSTGRQVGGPLHPDQLLSQALPHCASKPEGWPLSLYLELSPEVSESRGLHHYMCTGHAPSRNFLPITWLNFFFFWVRRTLPRCHFVPCVPGFVPTNSSLPQNT